MLLTAVALATNRMIAGSALTVVGDGAEAAALRDRAARLGARCDSSARPDTVCVTGVDPGWRVPDTWWRPATELPTVVIARTPALRDAVCAAVLQQPGVSEVVRPRPLVREFARGDTRLAVCEVCEVGDGCETDGAGASAAAPGEAAVTCDAVPGDAVATSAAADVVESASRRIDWALRGMPVLRQTIAQHRDALAGVRLTLSLVLEPKTAAFAVALAHAGAEVCVFAPVSETDSGVAAALAARGVTVCAPTGAVSAAEAAAVDARNARTALAHAELLVDDGSHLIRLAHTEHPEVFARLRGAAEETTSGVRPLREMDSLGALRIPVVAVNDARTKTLFDNRVGTGESCVFAMLRHLPELAAGTHWVVVGFGPVGEGVSATAAALGARVSVVDTSPVAALSAATRGYGVGTPAELYPLADVIVSATGVWHTLSADDVARAAADCVLAVAGGIDDEIALDELAARGWQTVRRTADIAELVSAAHGRRLLLAGGAGVNYTGAEGNPIEVMDLSFATQVSALAQLGETPGEPGVVTLAADREEDIARAALAARGLDAAPAVRVRAGGARQDWTVHRFRGEPATP